MDLCYKGLVAAYFFGQLRILKNYITAAYKKNSCLFDSYETRIGTAIEFKELAANFYHLASTLVLNNLYMKVKYLHLPF